MKTPFNINKQAKTFNKLYKMPTNIKTLIKSLELLDFTNVDDDDDNYVDATVRVAIEHHSQCPVTSKEIDSSNFVTSNLTFFNHSSKLLFIKS